jgi:hypothetical protein
MYANSFWGQPYCLGPDREEPWGLQKVRNLCMYRSRFIAACLVVPLLCTLLAPGLMVAAVGRRLKFEHYRYAGWYVQSCAVVVAMYMFAVVLLAPYPDVNKMPWYVNIYMMLFTTAMLVSALLAVIALGYGLRVVMKKFGAERAKSTLLVNASANMNRIEGAVRGSLVVKWLVAKKQRVCPQVEFVE